VWGQQGNKLVGTAAMGHPEQGFSVALSADGNTATAGGIADDRVTGAAWVHLSRIPYSNGLPCALVQGHRA
jgi:hypothetical protein